jgi:hypothetical protein
MEGNLHSKSQELNSDQIQECGIKSELNICRVSCHILRLTVSWLFESVAESTAVTPE